MIRFITHWCEPFTIVCLIPSCVNWPCHVSNRFVSAASAIRVEAAEPGAGRDSPPIDSLLAHGSRNILASNQGRNTGGRGPYCFIYGADAIAPGVCNNNRALAVDHHLHGDETFE